MVYGSGGPGYKSPLEAFKNGPRERILYVICIQPNGKLSGKPDYLATVNVDPSSDQYCKVIHRTKALYANDEWHHFGWNACSSCYKNSTKKRDKLVIPSLVSSRIYILDTTDQEKPVVHKVIQPEEVLKHNVSTGHTTHCLGTGEVMISTLGDANDEPKGDFLMIDGDKWSIIGLWTKGTKAKFGYDFWYQPYHDVMISSEWSSPKAFKKGFQYSDIIDKELTGRCLNVYRWSTRQLVQTIDLGDEGITPLEVKFLHNPTESQGYVGCAFSSNVFRFFKKEDGSWSAEKVIDIPNKKVEGWMLPEMPGLITALIISLDDKYLYINNWLQGDVRQYDITDRLNPKLTGQVFLGGLLVKGGPVKILGEQPEQYPVRIIKGTRIYGGPQMMQLSLDGKRLYVTTSLFSVWDNQVYPEMAANGSALMKVDVDTEKGGLKVDENFLVDFGKEPEGAVLAHECRYPGGDSTSDIWLNDCC
ncbi:hypothetical protein O3M35_002176 [Rhynocoris fuscipes]|uniref:Methanethiol oxidase n=1 Tax=Rhynocoris fuscipes TaxID=488301 RepID=A0AAW1CRM1_9HEMI